MGHPRRLRKKYATPRHPYRKERIEEENKLKHEYGLKNNREIWKTKSEIRKYRAQARKIQAETTEKRAQLEKELMTKMKKMGLVIEGGLDEVLSLTVKSLLDRRLQTIIFRKGLAKSMKQSRQIITHGHIQINGRKINVPSYTVQVNEETTIEYHGEMPVLEPTPEPQPEETIIPVETKPSVPAPREISTKPKIPGPIGGEKQ
ncbi:30S ribosomal protein S4 [archaeon]|nr:30S ribosomal protein S4 [archaeon]